MKTKTLTLQRSRENRIKFESPLPNNIIDKINSIRQSGYHIAQLCHYYNLPLRDSKNNRISYMTMFRRIVHHMEKHIRVLQSK